MWAVLSHPVSRGGSDSERRNLSVVPLPPGAYALFKRQNAGSLSGLFCLSLGSSFLGGWLSAPTPPSVRWYAPKPKDAGRKRKQAGLKGAQLLFI